ncbi:MAG: copper oxidase [Acidobacteria bacterium]|nr:copper oxidase [Acidobacteriota bacterium]
MFLLLALPAFAQRLPPVPVNCERLIRADVVAFDQPFFWNRLGAVQPQGMMYALRRDVVPKNNAKPLVAGNVRLRDGKRPRPLVLRMNVGDCLRIDFENLLATSPVDDEQPSTRTASVHVVGMQLLNGIQSDGSNVGVNTPSGLVAPNQSTTYTIYAEHEGAYMMYSGAATTGGEGDGGSINSGLFGAVCVEPRNSEWYRSQVDAVDMKLVIASRVGDGYPIIDYGAFYQAPDPRDGTPILAMLFRNEIVHSDLTAMITGPDAGRLPAGTYPPVEIERDRMQPFREIVTIYHDEIGAVQAFPQFNDKILSHTLQSVRDGFAINYGTGGIGAEILANRLGVGPMAGCTECKYEEFFLSAWAVGDPAMVVDVPANAPCTKQQIKDADEGCFTVQPKATVAFFPDDPSNVYHSYLRDHVKFRIVHAGSKEHHIHHQHAHQWLHTPDEDDSSYLDSQAIGPGAAFTLEMVYDGSGNRNLTVGDSIFHCHFYPHFAQGMWAMWRVHDVLELGTPLDEKGRPKPKSRALPDGEIMAGTPIPAVVPLPTIAMAPLPEAKAYIVDGNVVVDGDGNPGYPFFVPGLAGHRPPHPPLDTIDDGGLPRHIITTGVFTEVHNRLDFSKTLIKVNGKEVPELGTDVEKSAMKFHSKREHTTFTPEGTVSSFITNGLPPQPGAPYADPCITDKGEPTGNPRLYKSADFQLDVKFNKAGWHFFQQRISALWDDVKPTLEGTRAPEPLFFRANSRDCITFQLTNLVPGNFEQDDFQVRTPTDIVGQHIHLVKFDVTSSDGAGNGYNYEDGSFSPDEVIERIDAINAGGGLLLTNGSRQLLTAKAHPFFDVKGAQTTVQRWYADEVLNNAGVDRTLRTVFTHDHFGPSTHQQAGLYAGLVVEQQNAVWLDPVTGSPFGGRFDGGPTSWRADILTPDSKRAFREFLIEFADFQLAYQAEATKFPNPKFVINPPGRVEAGLPYLLEPPEVCPGDQRPPCPEAVSAADVGTMVVNYRNEPLAMRVRNPLTNKQASGQAGDLAFSFRSNVTRDDPNFNVQPSFYPPLTKEIQPGDPFTPLLEAYEGDRVQIRVLVGAHEEGHNFSVNGVKWLFEPSVTDSGWRNSQMMGISEHFEFIIPALPKTAEGKWGDFLYTAGRATDDTWNGIWGIMRAYKGPRPQLRTLPSNAEGRAVVKEPAQILGICPRGAPRQAFSVAAVRADVALPDGTLVYNSRTNMGGRLHDPTAILYVRTTDLDLTTGKLLPDVPIEPLVLRAKSGDCINLTLYNFLPKEPIDLDGYNTLPMIVRRFNNNQIVPSPNVGLHPQLVYYDVTDSDGYNVGFNPTQTAAPGDKVEYQWYAGGLEPDSTGALVPVPIEFGAANLMPADPIKQAHKGAIGSLIIEPASSTWSENPKMRAAAVVTVGEKQFQEFVLQFQTDINMRYGEKNGPVELTAESEDPEDSGQKAFNYRTEPMWKRFNYAPNKPLEQTRLIDFTNAYSNAQVGGNPETPVFNAKNGLATRFRVLNAGGHARDNVFALHGHVWREEPYVSDSHVIGANSFSEFMGAFMGIGPSSHFDILLEHGAGSLFKVGGDYLFRTQQSFGVDGGLWGILRVSP